MNFYPSAENEPAETTKKALTEFGKSYWKLKSLSSRICSVLIRIKIWCIVLQTHYSFSAPDVHILDIQGANQMTNKKIKINRAPVLTLWAAVVAERLGYDEETALTLGKAVAGLNAQSKGRRLGIYEEKTEDEKKEEKKKEKEVSRNLLSCLAEAFRLSKPHMVCALRSKAKPFMREVSKPISNRNSKTISMKHARQWRNWQKPIHPSNWKAKPTICMKSFARRFQREQKAGARKANWIWSTYAH
jgi:hypothetical protein